MASGIVLQSLVPQLKAGFEKKESPGDEQVGNCWRFVMKTGIPLKFSFEDINASGAKQPSTNFSTQFVPVLEKMNEAFVQAKISNDIDTLPSLIATLKKINQYVENAFNSWKTKTGIIHRIKRWWVGNRIEKAKLTFQSTISKKIQEAQECLKNVKDQELAQKSLTKLSVEEEKKLESIFFPGLSIEVLQSIFSHLDINSVRSVAAVCRNFRAAAFLVRLDAAKSTIAQKIYPLINICTRAETDAQKETVDKIFQIISRLPYCVVFPELGYSTIPIMQKMFQDLQVAITDPRYYRHSSVLTRAVGSFQKQFPSEEEKFLYNLPLRLLSGTDIIMREISRRHSLGQWTEDDVNWIFPWFKRLDLNTDLLIVTSVSLLEEIIENSRDEILLMREASDTLIEMKDREESFQKLLIFGNHFQKNHNKFFGFIHHKCVLLIYLLRTAMYYTRDHKRLSLRETNGIPLRMCQVRDSIVRSWILEELAQRNLLLNTYRSIFQDQDAELFADYLTWLGIKASPKPEEP